MTLLACGINHKTAPVDVREQIAIPSDQHAAYLSKMIDHNAVQEVAIVSTCNRTELYCQTENISQVLSWLAQRHELQGVDLNQHIYVYRNQAAVRHMMRVSCGLDSMVLGEPQILGQIKTAYKLASKSGTIGKHLGALFRAVFSVTKRIRTNTAIGAYPVSMAYASSRLVQSIFADLDKLKVLMIGAGETIELTARHLYQNGVREFIVANRTVENAASIAEQFNGNAISIAEVPEYLANVDIVITATASSLPILGKGAIETAIKSRKHRPLCLIDLAVPRDIEPEVASLPDVFLYNVDDLQSIVSHNQQERRDAAKQAESIIEYEVTKFVRWQRSLKAINTIRQYRHHLNNIAEQEIERAHKQLANGEEPADIIEELSHRITQKALHQPSLRLRKAGYDGREDMLKLAHHLFKAE